MAISKARMGEVGELAFALHAVREGIQVAFPHGHDHAFDFVTYYQGRCARVQVKATNYRRSGGYEVGILRKRKPHTEVDYYACYVVPEDMFYIIPVSALPSSNNITLSKYWDNYRGAWDLLKESNHAA